MNPRVVQFLDGFLPHSLATILAPSWFTCVGLAGVIGLIWMLVIARRHGIDRVAIASVVLWVYVAAVAAGIVVPMLIDAVQQHVATGHFRLRWAGMTSFWGYLAGGVALWIVSREHELPLAKLGDLAAAPIGLSLALARIGCFLGGCDYGKVSSAPWAVRFPAGSPAWRDQVAAGLLPADRAESLPVHPTQLYESLLGIAMCVLALVVARRKPREGRVFVAVIGLYAIGRIAIETLRGDAGRGIYAGLSSGQIFSVIVLVAIAASLVRPRRVHAAIAAAALLVMIDADVLHAQPAPPAPGPVSPYDLPGPGGLEPTTPSPAPTPAPDAPAPVPTTPPAPAPPMTAPIPAVPANPIVTTTVPSTLGDAIELGALLGLAVPLNRRTDQVPMLAGPAISIGYAMQHLAFWIDYDSYANVDATHATILFAASIEQPVAGKLHLGGRVGIGPTFVNFHDPAFEDVAGTDLRIEATAAYDVTDAWTIWARPLTFDTVQAADLGGPIITYQMSIGVAYRFHRHGSPPPPPQQPLPPPTLGAQP